MNILIVTRLITPYRLAWFDELAKDNKITVIYTSDNYPGVEKLKLRETARSFNLIKLKSISIFRKEISFQVIKFLKKKYEIVLFDGYAPLTNMLGIIYYINNNKQFFINIDGLLKPKKKEKIKNYFKLKILSKAIILCGSQYTKEQLISLGVDKNHCHVHNFTSLIKEDVLIQPLSNKEKIEVKNNLNITEKKIILSVGQLIYRKGYDILIEALKNIDQEIGVYIVGGKPSKKLLKLKQKYNLKNIQFVNFVDNKTLSQYYMAADLFILPTREDIWGLVINEAMARALPIITTDRCGAGIELIKDGVNGYIVKSENVESLQLKINELINNQKLLNKMASESLCTIKSWTIENMVNINNKVFSNFQ
jgi:glycosyltransferase involved in cell wall biosynthesis